MVEYIREHDLIKILGDKSNPGNAKKLKHISISRKFQMSLGI